MTWHVTSNVSAEMTVGEPRHKTTAHGPTLTVGPGRRVVSVPEC